MTSISAPIPASESPSPHSPDSPPNLSDWRDLDMGHGTPPLSSSVELSADHIEAIVDEILAETDDYFRTRALVRLKHQLHTRGAAGAAKLERLRADFPALRWRTSGAGVYGFRVGDETGEAASCALALGLEEDRTYSWRGWRGDHEGWPVTVQCYGAKW